MFNNIYQGKRVFLTGHTGFKGSWLALWLTKLGAEVCGYSHAPLLLDFQIDCVLKERKDIKTPFEKAELVKKVIPLLQEISNQIVQGEYVKTVAGVLEIDEKDFG